MLNAVLSLTDTLSVLQINEQEKHRIVPFIRVSDSLHKYTVTSNIYIH